MTAGPWPTYNDLSDAVARLLAEADAALSSNRWAIRNTGSEHVRHRLYDAAALRHCCLLLKEIEQAVRAGQEMTVRLAGRAFVEAWVTAVYLHFGGYDALTRIVQDTRKQTETTDRELKAFNQQLAKDKAKAQAKLAKVQKMNAGITKWNQSHPEQPTKPLLEEPHIPQLASVDIDLSDRIADFSEFQARGLPFSEVVAALTKLGPEKGFANETFAPIYLIYRMLSAGGTHPTIHVYDSYFRPSYFVSTAPEPDSPPTRMSTLITALYAVALLIGWVLSEPGHSTPVASQLRDQLQP
jgi:hypothetical protein